MWQEWLQFLCWAMQELWVRSNPQLLAPAIYTTRQNKSYWLCLLLSKLRKKWMKIKVFKPLKFHLRFIRAESHRFFPHFLWRTLQSQPALHFWEGTWKIPLVQTYLWNKCWQAKVGRTKHAFPMAKKCYSVVGIWWKMRPSLKLVIFSVPAPHIMVVLHYCLPS